jgi:hypothetical protein
MSQFPYPGVQKAHVGLDFSGTRGLYVPSSGGHPNKAVSGQELTTAAENLQSQVDLLKQNVKSNVSVAFRWNGTRASLIASLGTWSYGSLIFTPNAPNQNAGVQVKVAPANMSDSDIRSQSEDYLILIDEGLSLSTDPLATGFYYFRVTNDSIEPCTLLHADFMNPETIVIAGNDDSRDGIGTVIFVDKGNYADSFYTIPHSVTQLQTIPQTHHVNSTSVGDASVPKFTVSPWGRLQDLTPDPLSFLTIAGSVLSANVDANHFTVVSGTLQLSSGFLASVAGIAADVAALQTTVAQHTIDIDANEAAISNIVNNIVPTLTPKVDMIATIGKWYNDLHIIRPLTGGVFDVDKTTFTIALPAHALGDLQTIDWALVRLSEDAAPYTVVSDPVVTYDTSGVNRNIVIEFYSTTQVPDDTIEAYLMAFIRNPLDAIPDYVAGAGS